MICKRLRKKRQQLRAWRLDGLTLSLSLMFDPLSSESPHQSIRSLVLIR